MKHLFPLRSDATATDLKEAMHDVLAKAKAILTCIIFSTEFVREEVALEGQTLFSALCVADDCLDELMQLFQRWEHVSICIG